MYEAIIFDFDGVILNSEPIHYEACCTVFKKIGFKLSFEEYKEKYLGLADKEMFPLIFQHKNYVFSSHEIDSFIQQKIKSYIDIINHGKEFPIISGLEHFLNHLITKDKTLAICSGSSKKEIVAVLKKWDKGHFEARFKLIVTSEDVIHGKPSPEGYLLTAEKLTIPANKCLVIEDSPPGIEAAKKAGMKVIALLTTNSRNSLQHADLVVEDFNELLQQNLENHFS